MEKSTWRLILTIPAEGSWNMALDEALLEGMGNEKAVPVMRLFDWQPACLSLGYSQPFSDIDLDALHQQGWTYVRRPTGGRAILHTDEITYSVIAPLREPRVAGTILESYQRLSEALLDALQLLGLPARAEREYVLAGGNQNPNPVCFEVPSNYEITIKGKKIIGSAQARRREGVLQHGSLPLHGDLTRITQALIFPDEAARQLASHRLLERATTVAAELGRMVSWHEASEAFQLAFENRLSLRLEPDELTPLELKRTEELVAEKFGNQAWTRRI